MKLGDYIPKDIKEAKAFEYGCVMLYFDLPTIDMLHSLIGNTDVYVEEGDDTFGLEDEPHCTLLFGLHKEVTLEQVTEILSKFQYGPMSLENPSLFKNDKFDVLKYDVVGDNLHETNAELSKLPHTTNFPDYHPHCTLAYLIKGSGQRYVDILSKRGFDGAILQPTHAVFSQTDGTKTGIPISLEVTEGQSADYHKNNPEQRKKKQEYDAKLNKNPKQVKKRVEANKARREATKAGKNIKGKDASHTKDGIRFKESSKNRGSKSDSKGDKNARGSKK